MEELDWIQRMQIGIIRVIVMQRVLLDQDELRIILQYRESKLKKIFSTFIEIARNL